MSQLPVQSYWEQVKATKFFKKQRMQIKKPQQYVTKQWCETAKLHPSVGLLKKISTEDEADKYSMKSFNSTFPQKDLKLIILQ